MSREGLVGLMQDVALKTIMPLIPTWKMATVVEKSGNGWLYLLIDGETERVESPFQSYNFGAQIGDRVELRCTGSNYKLVRRVGGENPVGSITAYAGGSEPYGYLICDGSAFSPTMYPALFAVIGNTYGGTLTSPRLPNLQQRVPVGAGGNYALGATGGKAEHTLTVNEMPSHGHFVGFEAKGVYNDNPLGGDVAIGIETKGVTETGNNTNRKILATGNWNSYTYLKAHARGGNAAHNNMQPYTVVNWIIKVK